MESDMIMGLLTVCAMIVNLATKDKMNKFEIFAWQLCTLLWVCISMKGGL